MLRIGRLTFFTRRHNTTLLRQLCSIRGRRGQNILTKHIPLDEYACETVQIASPCRCVQGERRLLRSADFEEVFVTTQEGTCMASYLSPIHLLSRTSVSSSYIIDHQLDQHHSIATLYRSFRERASGTNILHGSVC